MIVRLARQAPEGGSRAPARRMAASLLAGVLLLFLFLCGAVHGEEHRLASCTECHHSLQSLLGGAHPAVKGTGIAACLSCHEPRESEQPVPRPFSARIHRPHVGIGAQADCTACHEWTPGKSFALPGRPSLGSPTNEQMESLRRVFKSWSASTFLDGLHAARDIDCAGCHGKGVPVNGKGAASDRCISCHGPSAELARQSAKQGDPERNPHDSHVGELDCTVCHHPHSASVNYCLKCHPGWPDKIPGGKNGPG